MANLSMINGTLPLYWLVMVALLVGSLISIHNVRKLEVREQNMITAILEIRRENQELALSIMEASRRFEELVHRLNSFGTDGGYDDTETIRMRESLFPGFKNVGEDVGPYMKVKHSFSGSINVDGHVALEDVVIRAEKKYADISVIGVIDSIMRSFKLTKLPESNNTKTFPTSCYFGIPNMGDVLSPDIDKVRCECFMGFDSATDCRTPLCYNNGVWEGSVLGCNCGVGSAFTSESFCTLPKCDPDHGSATEYGCLCDVGYGTNDRPGEANVDPTCKYKNNDACLMDPTYRSTIDGIPEAGVCLHDSVCNSDTHECECTGTWHGKFCEYNCDMEHFGIDSLECPSRFSWGHDTCEVYPYQKINGGKWGPSGGFEFENETGSTLAYMVVCFCGGGFDRHTTNITNTIYTCPHMWDANTSSSFSSFSSMSSFSTSSSSSSSSFQTLEEVREACEREFFKDATLCCRPGAACGLQPGGVHALGPVRSQTCARDDTQCCQRHMETCVASGCAFCDSDCLPLSRLSSVSDSVYRQCLFLETLPQHWRSTVQPCIGIHGPGTDGKFCDLGTRDRYLQYYTDACHTDNAVITRECLQKARYNINNYDPWPTLSVWNALDTTRQVLITTSASALGSQGQSACVGNTRYLTMFPIQDTNNDDDDDDDIENDTNGDCDPIVPGAALAYWSCVPRPTSFFQLKAAIMPSHSSRQLSGRLYHIFIPRAHTYGLGPWCLSDSSLPLDSVLRTSFAEDIHLAHLDTLATNKPWAIFRSLQDPSGVLLDPGAHLDQQGFVNAQTAQTATIVGGACATVDLHFPSPGNINTHCGTPAMQLVNDNCLQSIRSYKHTKYRDGAISACIDCCDTSRSLGMYVVPNDNELAYAIWESTCLANATLDTQVFYSS